MRLLRRQNRSERPLTPDEAVFIGFRRFVGRLWVVCSAICLGVALIAGDLRQWVVTEVMLGVEMGVALVLVWWRHCR